MNVKVNFEAILLSVVQGEYQGRPSYKLGLDCGGDVGTIPCSKEVYDYALDAQKYLSYGFEGTYNSNFKNLRVTACKM